MHRCERCDQSGGCVATELSAVNTAAGDLDMRDLRHRERHQIHTDNHQPTQMVQLQQRKQELH